MTLVSKKTYQYISLLNVLFQTDTTIDEVLDDLNVTRNTLISLVDSLNSIIEPATIEVNQNMLGLSFDHSTSYDEMISNILKETLEYNILLTIFFKETHSYLSLAEELFISESTIRRNIKELNENLANLDIHIKTNPVKLTGDEKNIRRLMVLIIKEVYGLDNLPFPAKDINYLNNIYKKFSHLVPGKKSIQDYNNFLLFTGVSFNRERWGHHFTPKKKTSLLIKSILKIRSSIARNPYFSSKLNIDNDELLINTLSLFLSKEFSLTSFKEKKIYNDPNYTRIENFLKEFNQLFNLNLSKNRLHEVSLELYDVVYGYLRLTQPIPIVNNYYENFMTQSHTFMTDLNVFIKKLFNKHIDDEHKPTYPFFYYVLSTRLPELTHDFINKIAQINILIYINFDDKFAEYIKNKLTIIIPGKINFTIINSLEDLENIKLFKENDLIITNSFNLSSEISSEKIIKISHSLTNNDIKIINDKIINFYQEKAYSIINNIDS